MALSRFGLMPAQFYKLCPVEFYQALADYDKQLGQQERASLEMMRLQTFYLLKPHMQKHASNDLRKFMPFPWDKFEVHIPTQEEWAEIAEMNKKLWEAKQSMN